MSTFAVTPPTQDYYKNVDANMIDSTKLMMYYQYVRSTSLVCQDEVFPTTGPKTFQTYDTNNIKIHSSLPRNQLNPGAIYQFNIFMDFEGKTVDRKVYNCLDLLADLGGLLKGLLALCGAFMLPISEFSFVISTLKKFYFVRVSDSDPDLFKDDKKRLSKVLKRREPSLRQEDIDKEPRLRYVSPGTFS